MKKLILQAFAAWVFLSAAVVVTSAAIPEYRAFWLDAFHAGFFSQAQVDQLLGVPGTTQGGRIRDANCNTVIVQVRRRYDVAYPSGVGEPYLSSLSPAGFNALAALIKAAHDTTGGKQRVEVHCWSVVFKTGKGQVYWEHVDPPTGSLTEFDNYWPTRIGSTTGAETGDGAFDPGHPKVLEYLVNAHMDLVNFQTTAGPDGTDGHIDGIHYDYIRFEGNAEGFNPTSVARFNARHGLTGDPASSSELFKQWRRDQVTAFVRQMYARIQKTKPWIKQSGSFVTWNPSPVSSTRGAFQNTRPYYDVYSDWDSWMQEGIFDIGVPMTYYNWSVYPNDYVRWMNFQKDRKGSRHMIVGPGIYLNSLDNSILELQMTRDPSPTGNYAQGFSGYSYAVPYVNGDWPSFSPRLVSDVTPSKADVPPMPWKTNPTRGHVMGTVTFAADDRWADHTVVSITGPVSRSQYVDGTGFYAFIDLPVGSYTISATLPGYLTAVTNVTIAAGGAETRNVTLSVTGPPAIAAQPQSQTVYEGAPVTFSATASGPGPLYYQWRFNGQVIPDATASAFGIASAATTDAGDYTLVVTNAYGRATSEVATLAVVVPQPSDRFIPHWSLAPGSRPYLGFGTDERGMAYNPVSKRLLVVNRVAPAVYVLDAETGADLHTLNTAGVSGGYTAAYQLLMIGAAEDGAIYACNLALNATSTPFKIYRWSDDNPNTAPTVAFSGNPFPEIVLRWGDTLDVRGSGTGTQILIGSRLGTHAIVFTTQDGTTFTPRPVQISGAAGGAFGLGIAFGTGNTFWGKATGMPLTLNSFDLATGTGSVLQTHILSGNIGAIGFSTTSSNLAGISLETPDNLQLYDVFNTSVQLVTTNAFATDNDNTTGTGSVDFSVDKIFALNTANGLLAMRYMPRPPPPVITQHPEDRIVGQSAEAHFEVSAAGSQPLAYQWQFESDPIPGATQSGYTLQNVQASDQGVYRVVVSNPGGAVTSAPAVLTVVLPPLVGSPPVSQTVAAGAAASFQVTSGTEDPSVTYAWLFNETPVPEANQDTYTIPATGKQHTGQYRAVLSNLGGSVTSAVATLTVLLPPSIDTHPISRTNNVSTEASFSVITAGDLPLSYQWWFNGTPIPGATQAGYTRPAVLNTDAGGYFVIVTNAVGGATSHVATLTVVYPSDPAITNVQRMSGNSLELSFTGGPGRFVLEASPDLLTWTNKATINAESSSFAHQDSSMNEQRLFYRIKRDP